ncbi:MULTISPECIES: gluconeogenesis factor YvcK family protein [Staphylococcus]|uniref:gluconeogenesis factor YvcK family protein n=1 Tax=Staphylococcus TaxID=1279 RepID=UPI000D03D670|nr:MULTISPECIES: YvcK family protein [Staphylococcus]UXV34577.1 YvcK family protein [Staphylococcus sp. IVB6181]
MKKLKIVLIGGGTGLSVLARGLKDFPIDITAIVTVADDGGSTGKIRSEMDIPAPGDIRNVIAALSDTEPTLKELFQYRFKENQVEGHSVGNLLIAALTNIMDDFGHAVKELSKILNIKGRVIPSTNSSIRLNAEMDDGEIVYGESNIPKREKPIKRVFIEPADVQPMEEAVEALEEADLIVLGPGSLYTSVLSNLCVPGIGQAIVESLAPKVYVSNVMTQHGETDHFDVMDHVNAIHRHMDTKFIDYVICCINHDYSKEILENYRKEHAEPVKYHKEEIEAAGIVPLTADDLVHISDKNRVRHNTTRLSRMIYELALDLTSTIQFNPKQRKK